MSLYIFNTSFFVPARQLKQWEQWLRLEMMPMVEKLFPEIMPELFEVVSASTGNNHLFSVQWRCVDFKQTEKLDSCVADLLSGIAKQFGDEVTHFSSIMEKIV